jgi:hypothetical protein
MLKLVFNHKYEIQTFVAPKGKPFAKFNDVKWMCEFTSVVDISIHLNHLNSCLQDKDQLINSMFCHIRTLTIKLQLWVT